MQLGGQEPDASRREWNEDFRCAVDHYPALSTESDNEQLEDLIRCDGSLSLQPREDQLGVALTERIVVLAVDQRVGHD